MTKAALRARFERLDTWLTRRMAKHGIPLLRISIGIVFLWFGALKLFPGKSPAEELIFGTMDFLPIPLESFMIVLGLWEMAIGLGFITGMFMRATIFLLFLQMPGTISPVILNPDAVFQTFPLILTLEGQYIVKNLVLISGALVVGATVRGGQLSAEPNTKPIETVEKQPQAAALIR